MAPEASVGAPLRTLLVDNYDSYTYNLYQLLAEVNGGCPPVVIRNDQLEWYVFEAPSFAVVCIRDLLPPHVARGWLCIGHTYTLRSCFAGLSSRTTSTPISTMW